MLGSGMKYEIRLDTCGQASEQGQSQGDEDISFHNRPMPRIYFNLLLDSS